MKDKDWYLEFSFGREDTAPALYAIIGVALDYTIATLLKLGFSRRNVIRFIDQVVRTFRMHHRVKVVFDRVEDYIIRDEEWLDVRVSGDVDIALSNVDTEPVKMTEVVITEVEEGETPLGGEMRATYDFVIEDENN